MAGVFGYGREAVRVKVKVLLMYCTREVFE